MSKPVSDPPEPDASLPLPQRVARRVRAMHLSRRTEEAYAHWTRRLQAWARERPVALLSPNEVRGFLSELAAAQPPLSASSHRQARSALLFLFREVLGAGPAWLAQLKPAPQFGPAASLSAAEVQRLLAAMQAPEGECALVARLLYGTGLRQAQVLRLRVKDIDFENRRIVLHPSLEGRPQQVSLPQWLVAGLKRQLAIARERWHADRQREALPGLPPDAASARALASWSVYWLFPAPDLSRDPRSGALHRAPLNERKVQRELALAAKRSGLPSGVNVQSLRNAFRQQLLQAAAEPGGAPPPAPPKPARKPTGQLHAYRRRSVHDDPSSSIEEPTEAYVATRNRSVREPAGAWRVASRPPAWQRRPIGVPALPPRLWRVSVQATRAKAASP